jgi:hypothetical protein
MHLSHEKKPLVFLYLKEVFADESNIKQSIVDFVRSLDENDSISFHNLEPKEQNYLRHALFISE